MLALTSMESSKGSPSKLVLLSYESYKGPTTK